MATPISSLICATTPIQIDNAKQVESSLLGIVTSV
jgi:hypothetical protein